MKKNIGKLILTTIIAASALSMSAFGEDVTVVGYGDPVSAETAENAAKDGIMLINETAETNPVEVANGYTTKTGKITSITAETTDEGEFLTITTGEGVDGIVFTTSAATVVYDAKDGSVKTAKDLTEGMEITAVLPANSIMTMSIPPMTPSAMGFVINAEGTSVMVGKFNDELVNEENKLALNISEETSIVSITGTKQILTAEDIKGNECLVIYGATTKSIPAQTSPIKVVILPTTEDELIVKEVEVGTKETVASTVTLRDAAVAAGFEVKWTANDAPVVLEKDGVTISVTLGSTAYTVNGEAKNFTTAVALENGSMVVSSEISEFLK